MASVFKAIFSKSARAALRGHEILAWLDPNFVFDYGVNEEKVMGYLHKKPDLETRATWAFLATPLMFACGAGNFNIVAEMLSQGADVNAIDAHGLSPIHFAAEQKNPEMIRALEAHGANVNAIGSKGWTPAALAARKGTLETLAAIVALGGKLDPQIPGAKPIIFEPFNLGCDNVNATVRKLAELGADLNACEKDSGYTALMHAAYRGEANVVRTLVEAGCDALAKNWQGRTALDFARSNLSITGPQIVRLIEQRVAEQTPKKKRAPKKQKPTP